MRRGLLSAAELSRERLDRLIESADAYAAGTGSRYPGAVVGLLFFAPSLRTRVGFEVAASRLGADVTNVGPARHGATMMVPETVEDTVRSVASWCDVLCLRVEVAEAIQRCATLTTTPILNCGNGDDEHPVQALVDLYAVRRLMGRLDHLSLAIVGDLSAMRTAHSLTRALSCVEGWSVRCIAPPGLGLPSAHQQALRQAGHDVESTDRMEVDEIDLLYVAGLPAATRIGMLAQAEQDRYHVDAAVVERMPAHARVLCPLPRVDEIAMDVDTSSKAAYFAQSGWSLHMRMALLDEQLKGRQST